MHPASNGSPGRGEAVWEPSRKVSFTPPTLLDLTQQVECELGRTIKFSPGGTYADRPIDINLIFYADTCLHTPRQTLLHSLMHL